MPLTTKGATNFLRALSDFWTEFFKDTKTLEALTEGIALNSAQLYQAFLESVLGTSLKDIPLFNRVFFAPYLLRESDLRYLEGASRSEDLFALPTGDNTVAVEYLTNRILAPTAFLTHDREFTTSKGYLKFRTNPFDTDGALTSLPRFPCRVVTVVTPACWDEPLSNPWTGVQTGDDVRIRIGHANEMFRLTGVSGTRLMLDRTSPFLQQDVQRRGFETVVLRTPFDQVKTGELLSDHPTSISRVTTGASDGMTIALGTEIDVSAEPEYQGAWVASTAYGLGDLVDYAGGLYKAELAHTSGLSFDASLWRNLSTGYFYIVPSTDPSREGFYRALPPGSAGRIRTASPIDFDAAIAVKAYHVLYGQTHPETQVQVSVPHGYLDGVEVYARRVIERRVLNADGVVTLYPAGSNVVEGVDYTVDRDLGTFTALSVWDPNIPARASYSWCLEVARRAYVWRGTYAAATGYSVGDIVIYSGVYYVIRVDHTSDGTVDSRYVTFKAPVKFDTERQVREIAVWGTDALIDEDGLYTNFGYLIDQPGATSEAYRVFLRAVSRLFLLGPTFERFESALNAIAGLPVVRDDRETLTGYDSGVDVSETGGEAYGLAIGADGEILAASARLISPSGPFLPDDIGASVSVAYDGRQFHYTILSVISATEAVLTPTPLADVTEVTWAFSHVTRIDRLRASGLGHRFSDADVGALIRFPDTTEPRNKGVFRILSVDDSVTAVLDTTYGLVDEGPMRWELSTSGEQTVTTDRQRYTFGLAIPLRDDVKSSGNFGVLTFSAFESISTAFSVVDYLEDASWWHHVLIPEELFPTTGLRRSVTPELIEHVYGALDGATYGDPGMAFGSDDEGRPGQSRAGLAVWYGGSYVKLTYAPGVPSARTRDVGEHLVVYSAPYAGSFKILGVEADGVTLRLENFPPRRARRTVPPVEISVALPPLLYRRTVAFVVMDKLLKYHCVQISVDANVELSSDLLEDAKRLIKAAKPSHVFVFFETGTSFTETVDLEEDMLVDFNFGMPEPLRALDTTAVYSPSGLLRFGDFYRYVESSLTFVPVDGVPESLPVALPVGPTAVRNVIKFRFETAARVGARQPVEGTDYDVDHAAGTVTIRTGVTITPSPVTVHYVDCVRRVLSPGDPVDPSETPIVFGGADPTFLRAADQAQEVTGILDRAIEVSVT